MRIGVDIRCLYDQRSRGIGHYAYALLDQLVHSEHQWVLVQTGRRDYQLPDTWQRPNVELVHHSRPNKFLNASMAVAARPKLDALAGGVDVFFAPNLGILPLQPRTPLVLTVHDLSFQTNPEYFRARDRAWHQAVRPAKLVKSAARLIAISQQTKQELIDQYDVDQANVSVIQHGIDPIYRSADAAAIAAVRRKYALPENYLLFIGVAEPRKNITMLLEGFRLARQSGLRQQLVLAGAVDPALRSAVGAAEGAHTIGYVDEVDKPALYTAATALTLVSHSEGFGLPPLEALACGTVSVVSDLPVFQETLGAAAIRVAPDAPADLAEKLIQLGHERSNDLVALGQPRLDHFTWPRCAAETLATIEAVGGAA